MGLLKFFDEPPLEYKDYQKHFEAIKNHSLDDLERILVVNDRAKMHPGFYSLVRRLIRERKRDPKIFLRYYWDKLVPISISLLSLVISLIALFK